MGSQSSKQPLTKADLEAIVARERALAAMRLKQELLAQEAATTKAPAAEPTITKADLELALERERVLSAARLKKELSMQQAAFYGQQPAFAPAPPDHSISQTGTPMAVKLYPELNAYSNHMPALVTVPLQQTNAPFSLHVGAIPSAPVFDNSDELSKQNNDRPHAHAVPSKPVIENSELPNWRNTRLNTQYVEDKPKCPTCRNIYRSYIYTCKNGHNACEKCRLEQRTCGICRANITSNRNINTDLNKYVQETQVSCPNKKAGCSLALELAELDAHTKVCTFKEAMCPLTPILGQCCWKGKLSSMPDHIKSEHPENCTAVNNEIIISNLTFHSWKVYFVSLGHYNFFVNIMNMPVEKKIYATVQHFGNQEEASKWDYEFHVYNKSSKRIKYMYTDLCHPHSTEFGHIISSNKCAVLPSVYYVNFVNSGTIACKFFIKKRYDDIKSNQRGTSNERKGRNFSNNRRKKTPTRS